MDSTESSRFRGEGHRLGAMNFKNHNSATIDLEDLWTKARENHQAKLAGGVTNRTSSGAALTGSSALQGLGRKLGVSSPTATDDDPTPPPSPALETEETTDAADLRDIASSAPATPHDGQYTASSTGGTNALNVSNYDDAGDIDADATGYTSHDPASLLSPPASPLGLEEGTPIPVSRWYSGSTYDRDSMAINSSNGPISISRSVPTASSLGPLDTINSEAFRTPLRTRRPRRISGQTALFPLLLSTGNDDRPYNSSITPFSYSSSRSPSSGEAQFNSSLTYASNTSSPQRSSLSGGWGYWTSGNESPEEPSEGFSTPDSLGVRSETSSERERDSSDGLSAIVTPVSSSRSETTRSENDSREERSYGSNGGYTRYTRGDESDDDDDDTPFFDPSS